MEEEKKCKDCVYLHDGFCTVVLWDGGHQYVIGEIDTEKTGCALWERR